jgi:hypothetical protein
LLTDEAKELLINSSLKERQADKRMLDIISSPDNPSRCSCSQVAPEEYHSDPGCCARGTELVFTWVKTGDLEVRIEFLPMTCLECMDPHLFCNLQVRLNGRLLDTFHRPDIAEGIFYEYLRHDDPISPNLRERVVDGFPFLLAPLVQVKGISIGHQTAPPKPQKENSVFRALNDFADTAHSHALAMGSAMQRGFAGAADNAGNAARTAMAAAQNMASNPAKAAVMAGQNLAKEMERRRDMMMDRTTATLPNVMMHPLQIVSDWVGTNITPPDQEIKIVRKDSLGRAFGYPLSRWFSDTYQAPDEIDPIVIHPTMSTTRQLFLALVHFYLLLLFIVSFPGSYTTRTKLVVRKSNMSHLSAAESAAKSIHKRALQLRRPSSTDRLLPCDSNYTSGRGGMLSRAAHHVVSGRPSASEESNSDGSDDNHSLVTPTSTPLKHKSFSYCL